MNNFEIDTAKLGTQLQTFSKLMTTCGTCKVSLGTIKGNLESGMQSGSYQAVSSALGEVGDSMDLLDADIQNMSEGLSSIISLYEGAEQKIIGAGSGAASVLEAATIPGIMGRIAKEAIPGCEVDPTSSSKAFDPTVKSILKNMKTWPGIDDSPVWQGLKNWWEKNDFTVYDVGKKAADIITGFAKKYKKSVPAEDKNPAGVKDFDNAVGFVRVVGSLFQMWQGISDLDSSGSLEETKKSAEDILTGIANAVFGMLGKPGKAVKTIALSYGKAIFKGAETYGQLSQDGEMTAAECGEVGVRTSVAGLYQMANTLTDGLVDKVANVFDGSPDDIADGLVNWTQEVGTKIGNAIINYKKSKSARKGIGGGGGGARGSGGR